MYAVCMDQDLRSLNAYSDIGQAQCATSGVIGIELTTQVSSFRVWPVIYGKVKDDTFPAGHRVCLPFAVVYTSDK